MHRRVVIATPARAAGVVPEALQDDQVWVVNLAGFRHPYATRHYFMDAPSAFRELATGTFADYINAQTDGGVEVYAREVWTETPGVTRLDVDAIVANLGLDYFTSTVAYMVAHAIHEGTDELVLWGCYHWHGESEYMPQKPCIEAWLGFAIARGIRVSFGGGSQLLKPYPGQAARYGEAPDDHEMMAAAFRQSVDNMEGIALIYASMEPIA